MVIVQNIWWLLVMIGVMILIHELGHYWAARYFDVHVEAFSFGFGPRLFGFRRGETDFRFSAIPFGGYVKMTGEQPGEDGSADPRSFVNKPRWQRLIIAFAGPAMNIILAVALLTGLFMVKYPKPLDPDSAAVVGHVVDDSPAAKAGVREGDEIVRIGDIRHPNWEDVLIQEISNANRAMPVTIKRGDQEINLSLTPVLDERTGVGNVGWFEQREVRIAGILPGMDAEKVGLRSGDILISVNGQPIRSLFKLQELIADNKGQPVEIIYARNNQRDKVMVQPSRSTIDGTERWMIGVTLEPRTEMTKLPFGEALSESVRHNIKSAGLIYQFLQGIVERRMSAKSLEGPIGIARLSGDAAREGPTAFVFLMAMVSLNLAIFNLLPIPILDGGVILLLTVEMLMRRDLSLQVKEAVFKLGFVFLMAVVVFVIYNDISKILPG